MTIVTRSIINDVALKQAKATITLPASLTQEGFWFFNHLTPDHAAHNIPVAVRIRAKLDREVLLRSLQELIQHHAILRSTFQIDGENLLLVTAPALTIELPTVDLQSWPRPQQEVKRSAMEEAGRSFDLVQGPLLRAKLLLLAPTETLLLLTIHQLILDERSLDLLLSDLTSLYVAFANSQASPLPDLPFQYTDFANWQREMVADASIVEQKAYWERQLTNLPEALELPIDRPRVSQQPSLQGAAYTLPLPQSLTRALEQLGDQHNTTLYMTLVAAFQTLLSRYTGQEDLLLGTIAVNRTRSETEAMLGLFTNMLILHSDLSSVQTFSELLAQTRQVVLDAQAHQELPFVSLMKKLQPAQQAWHSSLFQVLLSMEPPITTLPADWEIIDLGSRVIIPEGDLSLKVRKQGSELICRFEYRADLFDEATIARLAEHWQILLAGIVTNPTQSLEKIPLLSERERRQILIEWNDNAKAYPETWCLHELFEKQAASTPEAIALVLDKRSMSYQELNQRANQLAHALRESGVGPGVMVGICVERSPEMVVGLLGILKAGGINVPIDPAFPVERITFLLEDTQAPVLVTQQHLLTKLPANHPQTLLLDTDWPTISQQPLTNPTHLNQIEDLAYIIYTSGSTGQPKGVLLAHQAITHHCHNMIEAYELQAQDCCLQFSPFTFDASIEQTFPPLLVGARLLLRGPDVWTATEFLNQITEHQISVLSLPSAYWHQTISEWAATSQELSRHPIRLVIVGGDRLPPETVQLWRQTPLRSARLLNVYGPTEGTIIATFFEVPHEIEPEKSGDSISIGRPLPNRSIYILDKHNEPVPVGVAGELYIGGDLIARGYLNLPTLTAERFVVNPFSQQPQARLYKTGDLARYLPGGKIEFLGRGDQQVKIHGFRIEPGEIEVAINQHPGVRQAAVIAREDQPGHKQLVAYVVPQTDQETEQLVPQIRNLLKNHLPDYMIPAAFVVLAALPLTANGKLNRRELPMPEMRKQTKEDLYVAPSLPIHYQLVQIWENLLAVQPIGIRDNFFELGGHSLLAALLFERIAQVCGKKLPLSLFLADATIEHLATALLEESPETLTRATLVPVQVSGSRTPFFYLHGDYLYGAFYCAKLAHLLGPEQPFYILEPYKFDGLTITPSLEEIAAAYIETMRSVQTTGPYRLGGWCSGGLVAYEIARQLRAAGQELEILILMDPSTAPNRDRSLRHLFEQIGKTTHQGLKRQLNWYLRTVYTMRYIRRARFRRSRNAAPGSFFGPFDSKQLPQDTRFSLAKLLRSTAALRSDNELTFEWMASGYKPGTYADKITFFWTKEEPGRKDAWESDVSTREGEEHIIPGTHLTSRTNYLTSLAECLAACLNRLEMP
jgi:amino acid adenylation domain-containing protein